MADNTINTGNTVQSGKDIKDAADAFDIYNTKLETANGLQSAFGSLMDSAASKAVQLTKDVLGTELSLNQLAEATPNVINRFGLLASAMINVKKDFNFNGIDTSGLNLIGTQVSDVLGAFSGTKQIEVFTNMMSSLGASNNDINKAIKLGAGAMTKFATSMTEASDGSLMLQNAVLQNAAATGNLSNIYKMAGEDLGGMNQLLTAQTAIMKNAGDSTGLNKNQIQSYYGQLAKIPGAMNAIITGTGGANNSMSMLTATIKLATGSGREYKDVIADINTAYMNYGLTGQDALKFTARMSEVSNNLGVPLEMVRKSLLNSSEAFKSVANAGKEAGVQSDGVAGIMNKYFDTLKNAGATSGGALSMLENVTGAMSKLTLAQKAFLSQQSGGPGGLMGGFKIEKMLQEGKVSEVFEMARQQMMKQFGGKTLDLKDASSSSAGAAQYAKQRALLTQGPLGQLVKGDEDANRLMSIFKSGAKVTDEDIGLKPDVVQEQIKKGTDIESLSNTPISALRSMLQGMEYNVKLINHETLQTALTEKVGNRNVLDSEEQKNMRLALSESRKKAPPDPSITAGKFLKNTLDDMSEFGKNAKTYAKGIVSGVSKAASPEKKPTIKAFEKMPERNEIPFGRNFTNLDAGEKYDPSNGLRRTAETASKGITLAKKENPEPHQHTTPSSNSKEFNVKLNVHSICTVCGHDVGYGANVSAANTNLR